VGPTAWRKTSDLVEMRTLAVASEEAELKGIGTVQIHRIQGPPLQGT